MKADLEPKALHHDTPFDFGIQDIRRRRRFFQRLVGSMKSSVSGDLRRGFPCKVPCCYFEFCFRKPSSYLFVAICLPSSSYVCSAKKSHSFRSDMVAAMVLRMTLLAMILFLVEKDSFAFDEIVAMSEWSAMWPLKLMAISLSYPMQ